MAKRKQKQIEPCPYCSVDVEVKKVGKHSYEDSGYAFAWHGPQPMRPSFTAQGKTWCEGSGSPSLPVVGREADGR